MILIEAIRLILIDLCLIYCVWILAVRKGKIVRVERYGLIVYGGVLILFEDMLRLFVAFSAAFFLESHLLVLDQIRAWSSVFGALGALLCGIGLVINRKPGKPGTDT